LERKYPNLSKLFSKVEESTQSGNYYRLTHLFNAVNQYDNSCPDEHISTKEH
jgi:hypothetical protein